MRLKPPSCSVFFGNLHANVTDQHLMELGTQAGPVVRANRSKDAVFGFVEYADVESAIYCVGLYHGLLKLFGQPVTVNFSNSPVNQLQPQEQQLLDRCSKLIDLTLNASANAGAGAVRRGGRDAARYTPYGDARAHREQRAAGRAPTRFNDDDEYEPSYGARGRDAGQPLFPLHPQGQQPYAAPAAQPPPRPLAADAVAAMQAAAAAAAAAAGLGQQPLAAAPAAAQHAVQVQAGGWQVAGPAAAGVQLLHVPASNGQASSIVVVQQQQQPQPPPAAAPVPTYHQQQPQQQQQHYGYQHWQQQPQVVVQQQPAAVPVYPHTQQAQQQWQQQPQQPQQQYYQQQAQYARPPGAPPPPPAAAGGFQSSMPHTVQGQYHVQQQQQQAAHGYQQQQGQYWGGGGGY